MMRFAVFLGCALLSGCSTGEILSRGYVLSDESKDQVRVGLTQDQVLSSLGTPSTISTVNGDVFYYISQTHSRPLMFMKPKLIDQKVFAVYFDKNKKVERIGNYGLQDGKVFDFITRTTPTGGNDVNLLRRLLEGVSTT
jgi:outer membrane protein assembly factor BamE (lipoprotein component of BamABCDE complex)